MPLSLSADGARALMVGAQGLHRPPSGPARKADVLAVIRRLSALQIDTIHVVARSPYMVLWSRLGAYAPQWLDDLLAEGALFEYWAHAACFLPVEDYPLYRHRMAGEDLPGWQLTHPYLAEHRQEAEQMLAHIREQGPVRSADFQRRSGRGNGWWDWKPEKRLLEALFNAGLLMVARRQSFQRVYDLRERVLPSWNEAPFVPAEEAQRTLLLRAVRALGIATPRWAATYFYLKALEQEQPLAELASEGRLLSVEVDGWEGPAYIHPSNAALAQQAAAGALVPEHTTLLSPFDPLISDRARTQRVFSFDYALECYLPAAKRRYGYYCLPILHHGELVGRLDAKAHRKDGVFEVKALYLEPGLALTGELATGLSDALSTCAAWHETPEVVVRTADPPEAVEMLAQVGLAQ